MFAYCCAVYSGLMAYFTVVPNDSLLIVQIPNSSSVFSSRIYGIYLASIYSEVYVYL